MRRIQRAKRLFMLTDNGIKNCNYWFPSGVPLYATMEERVYYVLYRSVISFEERKPLSFGQICRFVKEYLKEMDSEKIKLIKSILYEGKEKGYIEIIKC